MAAVTAAAAVIAIAVTLVIVKDVRDSSPVPFTYANFPAIPVYYVALNVVPHQRQIVVGNTFTGARLATISPPAHSALVAVTGAADDRTFVVGSQAFPLSPARWDVEPLTWYLLRIAPGTDHPARLARLHIPATPSGLMVAGMALSPDGSKFAVALEPNPTLSSGNERLLVYSVATGALLRTWTGPPSNIVYLALPGTENNTTLAWLADGHTLAFDYGPGIRAPGLQAGVRMLDTSRPGDNLLADSRPSAWSVPPDGFSRPVATADGKVVCVTSGPGPFLEYSTATGNLTHTLDYPGTPPPGKVRPRELEVLHGEVLWISPSGDALIGSITTVGGTRVSVGVITQSGFRPLSFPLARGVPLPNEVAW